jgi:hypothetical protein
MWALHGAALPLLRTEVGINRPPVPGPKQSAITPRPAPLSAQGLLQAAARDAWYTLDGKPLHRNQPVPDGVYLVKQGNRVFKAIVLRAGL